MVGGAGQGYLTILYVVGLHVKNSEDRTVCMSGKGLAQIHKIIIGFVGGTPTFSEVGFGILYKPFLGCNLDVVVNTGDDRRISRY